MILWVSPVSPVDTYSDSKALVCNRICITGEVPALNALVLSRIPYICSCIASLQPLPPSFFLFFSPLTCTVNSNRIIFRKKYAFKRRPLHHAPVCHFPNGHGSHCPDSLRQRPGHAVGPIQQQLYFRPEHHNATSRANGPVNGFLYDSSIDISRERVHQLIACREGHQ